MSNQVSMVFGNFSMSIIDAVDFYKYYETNVTERNRLKEFMEHLKIVDTPLREDQVPPFFRFALWVLLNDEPPPALNRMPKTYHEMVAQIDEYEKMMDAEEARIVGFDDLLRFDVNSLDELAFPQELTELHKRVETFLETFRLYESHYSADSEIIYQSFPHLSL